MKEFFIKQEYEPGDENRDIGDQQVKNHMKRLNWSKAKDKEQKWKRNKKIAAKVKHNVIGELYRGK